MNLEINEWRNERLNELSQANTEAVPLRKQVFAATSQSWRGTNVKDRLRRTETYVSSVASATSLMLVVTVHFTCTFVEIPLRYSNWNPFGKLPRGRS